MPPADLHASALAIGHAAPHQPHPVRPARGYSLIEILLTLLIVGIGILGMGAANVASLRARAQSSMESVATQQANAIVERLRAQTQLARGGAFNRTLLSPAPGTNTTSLAEREIGAWLEQLRQQLPSGTGAVEVAPDGRTLITVQWTTPVANEAARPTTLSLRTRL